MNSGYGDGYGSASGGGYGDGDGLGSGYVGGYGGGTGSGSCSGSGYGNGDGCGYGCGTGYGTGYGSCSGSGYGYGDGGGGYGYGDGGGTGYGYGDGSGDGSGYGDGYGDGSKEYWASTVDFFAEKWPDSQRLHLASAREKNAVIAFWRSDREGRPCNGGNGKPVAPGTVEKIAGPLSICSRNALHATSIPPKWKGERWWIVALFGEVVEDDDKFGALHREIIGECL